MGQKVHPSGARVGKFLTWESQWFSKNKQVTSQLVFKNYTLKNLLASFLLNKNLLIHSFESKFFNNTVYLTIFVLPTYLKWLAFKKYNFSRKTKFILEQRSLKNYLLIKKKLDSFSLKNTIPSYLFQNIFKIYLKSHLLQIKSRTTKLVETPVLEKLNVALLKFFNLPRLVLRIRNLSSYVACSNYQSTTSLATQSKTIMDEWMYMFRLMNIISPSALLIATFLKLILEKANNRKQQRRLLNSLRRFIIKNSIFLSKIQGLQIQVKGRINGRNRSTKYNIQVGRLPLQTFSKPVDYVYLPIFTLYGTFGMKVWVIPTES
jgi:ribosomal protein S3